MDAVHQYAASVCVGALMHRTVAAAGPRDRPWPPVLLQRFSSMALGAVVVLVAAGIGLTPVYVDGPYAVVGTPDRVVVLPKIPPPPPPPGPGGPQSFTAHRPP